MGNCPSLYPFFSCHLIHSCINMGAVLETAAFAPIGEKIPLTSVARNALSKGSQQHKNPIIFSFSNAATPKPFSAKPFKSGTSHTCGNSFLHIAAHHYNLQGQSPLLLSRAFSKFNIFINLSLLSTESYIIVTLRVLIQLSLFFISHHLLYMKISI